MTGRMVKVKKVYLVYGKSHVQNPRCPEDMFIGLFEDGTYHFLGCRPEGLEYLLPDQRQSDEDWGIIILPKKVSKLEKMIPHSTFITETYSTNIKMVSEFIKIKRTFQKKSI